jgi:hypothetical protein
MLKSRTLLFAGALGLATTGSALAQGVEASRHISLGGLVKAPVMSRMSRGYQAPDPISMLSLRGGAMVTPRGSAVVGIDASMPTVSLGNGWHGRLDADVIIKGNLGGVNTSIPVTFDQLYYSPNEAGGHNVYYGAGVGAIFGGDTTFDAKLILGTELTSRLGAEVNVHFNDRDTLVMLLARIHL